MRESNKVKFHPSLVIKEKISYFEKNLNIEDFIEAIKIALHKKVDVKELCEAWNKVKANIRHEDHLEIFSKLLGKIYISYQPVSPENPNQGYNLSQEDNKKYEESFRQLVGWQKYLSEKYEAKYSWFYSSWSLGELLKLAYPEELDPARIIGGYLKLLFPDIPKDFQSADSLYYQPQFELQKGSQLYQLVSDVGIWAIDNFTDKQKTRDYLKLALSQFLDPEGAPVFPVDMSMDKLLTCICEAPQSFFHVWVYGYWLDGDHDFCNSPQYDLPTIKAFLQNYPIGVEKPSAKGLAEKEYGVKEVSFDLFKNFCMKSLYTSWRVDSDLKKLSSEYSTKYSNVRNEYYSGLSVIDYHLCNDVNVFFKNCNLADDEIDYTVLLTEGQFSFGDMFLFEVSPDASYFEMKPEFDKKLVKYLYLFRRSIDEGFSELGNAFLSLYVFALGMYSRCRMTNLKVLEPVLREALRLPGCDVLKHTLKRIAEWAEADFKDDPFASLTAMVFRGLLPKEVVLKSFEGVPKKKRHLNQIKDVEDKFVALLGEDRWLRLSEISRTYLRDAELQWNGCYHLVGFGLQDASGLVLGYCKAVERELVERFSELWTEKPYKVFLREQGVTKPDKITAGNILKDLRHFSKLPDDIKGIFAKSRFRGYEDGVLVKNLSDMFNDFRNPASHKEPFGFDRFAKFRQMFFDGRLIHDFIDALE